MSGQALLLTPWSYPASTFPAAYDKEYYKTRKSHFAHVFGRGDSWVRIRPPALILPSRYSGCHPRAKFLAFPGAVPAGIPAQRIRF